MRIRCGAMNRNDTAGLCGPLKCRRQGGAHLCPLATAPALQLSRVVNDELPCHRPSGIATIDSLGLADFSLAFVIH